MSYELKIVNYFNNFFKSNNISAIAYRLKQAKFCGQICDILVDSKDKTYYLAIECKTTKYGLYFSSNFSDNQVLNITKFIKLSGRTGVLALKDRKEEYLIPWDIVDGAYLRGDKSIKKQHIINYKINFENLNNIALILTEAFSEN